MLKILFTAFILSTSSVWADEVQLLDCKIQNLKDAKKCMKLVALKLEEYEEPNQAMVSTNKNALYEAMESIGVDAHILRQVQEADYVGAVLQHGDEHQFTYYTFTKAHGLKELCYLNVVDLDYSFVHTTDPNNFFLGLDGSRYDAFSDIVNSLKEFENKN